MYTTYDQWKLATPEQDGRRCELDEPEQRLDSPAYIRTKHIINNATYKTYEACLRYVALYLELEYENEHDKKEIKFLTKLRLKQIF